MLILIAVLIVVLLSVGWVYFDATTRLAEQQLHLQAGEERTGRIDGSSPRDWASAVGRLWIVHFPEYLRLRFRNPGKQGHAPAIAAIAIVVAVIGGGIWLTVPHPSAKSSIPADVQVPLSQTISYSNGFQIQLSDYTSNDTAVDGLGAPMGGGHFDAADIQATTTGSSALTLYLPGRLTVIGSDNQSYGVDNSGRQTTGCRTLSGLNSANVLPNQQVNVCLTFVLPDGVTAKSVEYNPGPKSTVAVWTL